MWLGHGVLEVMIGGTRAPRLAKDVFAENLETLVRLWTEERVVALGRCGSD